LLNFFAQLGPGSLLLFIRYWQAVQRKFKKTAGAFIDTVLAVGSTKLYLDPVAMGMAGVFSHNERFFNKQSIEQARETADAKIVFDRTGRCIFFLQKGFEGYGTKWSRQTYMHP